MRSIDAHVFEATPGGRSISDTYDFAGLDPDVFAKIKPVKTKNLPDEIDKPPSRKLTPRPRANEVLELGSKTLGYIVMTTKIFVENLSLILNNSYYDSASFAVSSSDRAGFDQLGDLGR